MSDDNEPEDYTPEMHPPEEVQNPLGMEGCTLIHQQVQGKSFIKVLLKPYLYKIKTLSVLHNQLPLSLRVP